MRVRAYLLLLPLTIAAAAFGVACEKNNDIVVLDQFKEASEGCPQGCAEPLPGCVIKGNISERGNKFYHMPGFKNYDGIIIEPDRGERWFCTEEEAAANGWRRSLVDTTPEADQSP